MVTLRFSKCASTHLRTLISTDKILQLIFHSNPRDFISNFGQSFDKIFGFESFQAQAKEAE